MRLRRGASAPMPCPGLPRSHLVRRPRALAGAVAEPDQLAPAGQVEQDERHDVGTCRAGAGAEAGAGRLCTLPPKHPTLPASRPAAQLHRWTRSKCPTSPPRRLWSVRSETRSRAQSSVPRRLAPHAGCHTVSNAWSSAWSSHSCELAPGTLAQPPLRMLAPALSPFSNLMVIFSRPLAA